ncbi:putative transcriptional regulator [Caenibius tardaugens NBRC 16725]|uniref:Putative transcriptional regulator n=1 Tax=Caenibius tardaugens NBRC 16725 TaxID=1219035 RepID=U2ZY17_9SPHN|nr:TetR/AcrR family transcriptional regulator [Caenibius tardaugens]GAD47418.1 putative transcriptional regulator [Caenibius tardaugens NBRC 16725]
MAGRPAKYCRETVIGNAMAEFWSRGFVGSDIDGLTGAAGVNRHSLYKAFGGKRGLFLDALRHYVDGVAAGYVKLLEQGSGLDDICAYFAYATGMRQVENPDAEPQGFDQRGCFLVNTAIELGHSDPQVTALLEVYYARIENAFAGLIRRGQESGSIRSDIDPHITARWLRVTSQGLSVSSRMGSVPGDLTGVVRMALATTEQAKGERG